MSFQETVEQKIIQETRRLVSPEAELEVCVKEDGSTCTIILKDNILTSKTLSDFRKMLDRVSEIISPAVQELTPMEQVAAEIMDAHAQARTAEAQARTAEILNAARNPGPQPSQPTPEPRPSRKRRLGLTGRVVDPLHAVPDVPFGHLNPAWKAFLGLKGEGEALWSFRARWVDRWGRVELHVGYVWVADKLPKCYFRTEHGALQRQ